MLPVVEGMINAEIGLRSGSGGPGRVRSHRGVRSRYRAAPGEVRVWGAESRNPTPGEGYDFVAAEAVHRHDGCPPRVGSPRRSRWAWVDTMWRRRSPTAVAV